jgi:hypothetical protein
MRDQHLRNLKDSWFANPQTMVDVQQFVPIADEWFRSTKLNTLDGWSAFPCVDVILGCTHFIESLVLKHGWDGIQILPGEYAYYGLMGKHGTEPGNLTPGVPLIISLPNWSYADLRPEWTAVVRECEAKDIDIHIDFAWITTAKDIELDLDHPNIKSFAMSLSKYSLQWNRIGLRWSRQRTVDSITIFNRFEGEVNTALTSAGAYVMANLPRDYGWDTYGRTHYAICRDLNLNSSKIFHVVHDPVTNEVLGIGNILSLLTPDNIK